MIFALPLIVNPSPFVAEQALKAYEETLPNTAVKFQMTPIEGGAITISGKSVAVKAFYIAKTETTWEAFDAFLSSGEPSPAYDQTKYAPDAIARPSKSYILPDLGWGHAGFPVINVSFTNTEMFCRWLSKTTGKKYRVPTEAEWELACRGGETGDFGMAEDAYDKVAWFRGNSEGTTHAVGKKAPNKFGLFDVLGNAAEWATDMDGKWVLCGSSFKDKVDSVSYSQRRYYSPKWQDTDPQIPKSRWWYADGPFCGFRVVCEP